MKTLVAITGASGTELGFYLLSALETYTKHEIYAILSKGAKQSFSAENKHLGLKKDEIEAHLKSEFKLEKTIFLDDEDLSAPVSSGSFGVQNTIVAPCSLNTLAKISNSLADTLITRTAAVALKERRKLILGVREMPLSALSLEQMTSLAKLGVLIAPPVYASYFKLKNLEDLRRFIIGKWLDLLEIEHDLYERWGS